MIFLFLKLVLTFDNSTSITHTINAFNKEGNPVILYNAGNGIARFQLPRKIEDQSKTMLKFELWIEPDFEEKKDTDTNKEENDLIHNNGSLLINNKNYVKDPEIKHINDLIRQSEIVLEGPINHEPYNRWREKSDERDMKKLKPEFGSSIDGFRRNDENGNTGGVEETSTDFHTLININELIPKDIKTKGNKNSLMKAHCGNKKGNLLRSKLIDPDSDSDHVTEKKNHADKDLSFSEIKNYRIKQENLFMYVKEGEPAVLFGPFENADTHKWLVYKKDDVLIFKNGDRYLFVDDEGDKDGYYAHVSKKEDHKDLRVFDIKLDVKK